MQAARRAYVYFITAVSLGALAIGLTNLLRIAFEQLAQALGWRTVIGQSAADLRRDISLYAAVAVVALPIWLVHWTLAQRAAARSDEDGEIERHSSIRALFFTLVLLVSFWIWVTSGMDIVRVTVARLFNSADVSTMGMPSSLAIVLVTGLVWAYHGYVRRGDLRRGELTGDAISLPRFYRYVALFAGTVLLLVGAMQLLNLIGDAVFGRQGVIVESHWWVMPLADGIASIVIGAIAWTFHWWYGLTLLARDDWLGASERQSLLRRGYFYLVVLLTAVMTLIALSSGLETVLRAMLGVPVSPGGAEFARHLVEPLVGALPWLGFWLFHRRRLEAEARQFYAPEIQESTLRFYRYGLALIGLAFTGVGTADVAGILIDLLAGGTKTVGYSALWWRGQVSQYGAVAVVGAALWLWHWYRIQTLRTVQSERERWTLSRRLYLYTALAGSLVAGLAGLSVVLYRLFNLLLDVTPSGGLTSAISMALGVSLVAVALLAYHGLILRRDMAERPAPKVKLEIMPLVLTGPAGADFEAELKRLRTHLDQGFELRSTRERA